VFENKVLRRICDPKGEEVVKCWRRLHNEELNSNLYALPDIIRVMRWAGFVARMGEMRNACKILVGKPEGKRLLSRTRVGNCALGASCSG
jgi:hypothetical protein